MITLLCPECGKDLSDLKCWNCGWGVDSDKYIWYGTTIKEVTTMKDHDPVNSPSHYGQGKIEAIEYIEDLLTKEECIGYLRGNIAKYLHRWRYKNQAEDLKKAQWYLNRLLERITDDQTPDTHDSYTLVSTDNLLGGTKG